MLFWIIAVAHMTTVPALAPPLPTERAQATDTVVVRMVNKSASAFAFAPAHVTVHPGDVLEFLQTGDIPHDVAFTEAPAGARIAALKVGPFLNTKGQTYDLIIDGRFPPGHYAYDCLPHLALGMKGTFDVVSASTSHNSGR